MEIWKNTGIKKQVIEEIRSLPERYNISRVILFGSRARGDFYRTSDIDLAVSGGDYIRLAVDIEEETSTLLHFDIVDLDAVGESELRSCIEREGVILYEKI